MEGSQELSSLEASFLSMPTLCTANHSQVPLPSFFCVAFSFCLLPSLASFALSFLLLAPHKWLNPVGCVCVCVCVCVLGRAELQTWPLCPQHFEFPHPPKHFFTLHSEGTGPLLPLQKVQLNPQPLVKSPLSATYPSDIFFL